MIQGGEDVSSGNDIPEQSNTNGTQQVNPTTSEQVQSAHTSLSAVHRQRIVSQTFGGAQTTVTQAITAADSGGASSVDAGSDASSQQHFISGASVDSHLQNVAIPVTSSLQETAASSSGIDGTTANSSYNLGNSQNLAHILAVAGQNCNVRTGGMSSQNLIVGVSSPVSQSDLQLVNSPTMTINVPNLQMPAVCCAVVTLPVTTATTAIVQKPLLNGGRQDNVSMRLTPNITSAVGQQTLILGSTSSGVQPEDVTRVHSYSLASASSTLVPSSNLQHVHEITPNRVMMPVIPSQKGLSTSNHAIPAVSPLKRLGEACASSVTTVNKFGPSVTNLVSPVNNITSFSTAGFAFTTSNPQNTVVGSGIPNYSSHRPKRVKLEMIPPADEGIAAKRRKICDYRLVQLKSNRERYHEELIELFFLQSSGNMMDFWVFRKRPVPPLLSFLRANVLDSEDEDEQKLLTETKLPASSLLPTGLSTSPSVDQGNTSLSSEQLTQLSKSVVSSSSSSQLQSHSSHHIPLQGPATPSLPESSVATSSAPASAAVCDKSMKQTASAVASKMLRQHSISAVYDSSIGSQEEIVERAKQEAYVMQRISELRKEGLWSMKRLPKVQEPPRTKAHWDYLLEEMVWLATDFAQERKWKKAAAKKCARMVLKFHQEKELKAEKAEKEEQMKLRKIASQVAKEIKQFWANIEKLVEYKQNTLLEEKRKKFLDLHLNFIVDQTEKYSSWLAQGMNRGLQESTGTSRASSPVHISPPESPQRSQSALSYDNEFLPENSESDDEETIEKEEENVCDMDQEEEIKLLREESEVPLEELIESLPPEIFEKPASLSESETSSEGKPNSSYFDTVFTKEDVMMGKVDVLGDSSVEDDEFTVSSEEEDDESTIQEQENKESTVDYDEELKDLQAESELPIEDLYLKYADAYASDFEVPDSDESSFDDKDSDDPPSEEKIATSANEDKDHVSDLEMSMDARESSSIVMDDSMQDFMSQNTSSCEGDMCQEKNPTKEITDIAATAERFQPKGNTLSTTQVCTKVPFLLKHTLREYQHIGLDWLNAMYDKKLNGILADEMGLGKTIQTISLLAHLACEKSVWGPHLIVVPTSVMLNWEMEFKKWCPGFKILTYYGTPKERKQKRMGWTKPNAFHVCITSYKLVIQDHHSFRRKKWKYFILDEAQNIKNFRSQRWQMLLNFQSSHRLLLTGTPLQNSLVELWSLMHFLMPTFFKSHRDFKDWFVNPVSGMIEGNVEYNEGLIKRLHKILRPFLLRRLKSEVEKQLPKKYEHIIMCRLSKRQRFLYDDFMAQTKTRETLATGNFMSVINVLMQLRKVCNHPNMFEVRPVVSPFMMEGICYQTASLVWSALDYNPFKHVSLWALNLLLADLELCLTAFAAHRIKKFQTPPRLIEEIDSQPDPPPRCPAGKIRLHVQNSQVPSSSAQTAPLSRTPSPASGVRISSASVVTRLPATASALTNPQRYVVMPGHHSAPSSRATSPVAAVTGHQIVNQQPSEYTLQLLQQPAGGGVPVAQLAPLGNQVVTSAPITVQIQQTVQGGARLSMPLGIGRLVQTSTGQHLLLTPAVSTVSTDAQHIASPTASTMTFAGATNSSVHLSPLVTPGPMVGTATVLPQVQKVATTPPVMPPIVAALSRPQNTSVVTALSQIPSNKPVGRVAPLNIHPPTNSSAATPVHNAMQVLKSPVVHSLAKTLKNESSTEKRTSLFYLESLSEKREKVRRESLKLLGLINRQRCAACPIYGHDLIEAVTVTGNMKHYGKSFSWGGRGYVNCLNAPSIANRPRSHWLFTRALCEIIDTPERCIERHLNIINRFVFVVPAVTAPCIQMHMSHPPPSKLNAERLWEESLTAELSPRCALLHPVISNMKTQFPDLRLIEYDCGKLQRLSALLWELKSNHHRVLVFTQMTRMLDILEQFLNYHGHTYLRLDGTTKVEERQALMETFNMDKRYFCFILSTRSGGIGVNLTGADTVIFYDSDWNPTMDAQAQDRCHRIGQTRDVHIYRLISEKTIEENILKKANQKRLLGDLAIEGGNFTTAFFKMNAIQELFYSPLDDVSIRHEEPNVVSEESTCSQPDTSEKFSEAQLEQALGMAEEELDLQAARTANAEAAAELAEFDESIPLDSDSRDNEEKSPAEEELEKLMDQLTPVEKYALQFLESLQDPISEEQFELAKEEIEAQKKDWELERLKALKEEEERRSGLLSCDEDPLLSYGRTEAYDQVYISVGGQEEMPIWAPPTPPQDENDLYIDYSFGFCYEHSLMPESQLPPIYVKKEAKRLKVDTVITTAATTRKQKIRKDDSVYIPRSLFDRPSAAILKMRREAKIQKVKGLVPGTSAVVKPSFLPLRQAPSLPSQQLQSHSMAITKPAVESHQDIPEWLVHEDWAILQVIQNLQGLSLSLAIVAPAHFANWDLVADSVNAVSRIYRSPKQCKNRYESVVVPREEGKILYDPNLKKQKKTKGIYKTKSNRPMRTSQLYQQDNNGSFTRLYGTRCSSVADVAKRHSPSMKTFTQSGKNPKHASVLTENNINYDQPLTPMQVAVNRADRIQREKQKNQAVAAAQAAAQVAEQQQLVAKLQQQQHVQQQVGMPVAGAATIGPHQAQAVIASLTPTQQLQTTQLGKTALTAGTVTTVSLSKPIGGGIMVNAATASSTPGTFATISKALSGVSTVSTPGVAQNASVCGLTSGTVRNQRSHVTSSGSTTTMAVQETVTAVASLSRGLTTSSAANGSTSTSPAVVSVAGLTAVQLQAAASQRISASTLAAAATNVPSAINQTGTQVATTRNMTQSQLQVFRQTAILRQQRLQEQQLKQQQQQLKRLQVASAAQQVQQAGTSKVSVSSNSPLSATVAAAAVAAAAQQRAVQQQAAVKQSIGRAVTEAEVAQLLKRHQQKQAVAAQLQTAQILAQVQQQQQVQAAITGAVQTPVATLVKTVSAPTSLGGSPSVAIPVSAVTMAGVNINVSLPQAKAGNASTKGATTAAAAAAATVTQHQLRQLQLHQQLLQQRKIQKVTSVAQLAKVAGKNGGGSTAALPSTTVQILQHGAQATGNQQGKSMQAASGGMTVQQIQQVIKQVLPPHIPVQVSNAQVTTGSSVTTSLSQNQLLSHHAVLQGAATPVASISGIKTSVTTGHSSSSTIAPSSSSVQSLSSSTPPTGSTAPVQTRIIPVCQASPASTLPSTQSNLKQTIQVVTASPNVTASLQQTNLRGEPSVMASGVKAQTTTLPSTTLTSTVLKGSPAVVVSGQQTTAAIIQQVASSNASLLPSQAVTLAVRAAASQAAGQPQVQIQVQQTPASLMASQSQIQQLSQNSATINLSQSIPIQASTQVTSVLTPATGIAAMPSSMTIDSPTHVVMSSPQTGSIVMPPGLTSSTTTTAQVVQAALQAAKQQQQAAQQQRASPYTMRLRNPPK